MRPLFVYLYIREFNVLYPFRAFLTMLPKLVMITGFFCGKSVGERCKGGGGGGGAVTASF
jgi:hypothetical protein